ncbi:MAG: ABC transporter ATP-binding protein [Candidatus Methanomethylophilaceae archaeon]|nr:ABC transporter ATP-binding protein [Candidatus Methanomethylophilaceae archaeon]
MQVEADDVSFSYKDKHVLESITQGFDKGEIVSIIGPNGVGKSTFLHCLNRLLTPSEGKVLVDGRSVEDYSLKDLAKEMGYVPYSPASNFPLSVIDMVIMGRHPYSRIGSSKDDLKAVHAVLERLDIDDLAFRPFTELSAGQRQKVMIARGLVQEPEVLLLDEPTANLDIKHQMEVASLLKELSKSIGLSVIMVSHELNIAAKYSDRMVLLHQGRIFKAGSPWEVITSENIREVYSVDAEVIDHSGRPYVLLNKPLRGRT